MSVDCYLTSESLVLSKPNSKVMLDDIPLTDVVKVESAADTSINKSDIGGAGTLVLRAVRTSDTTLRLEARAQSLANTDMFSRTDPFLRILLQKDLGDNKELYRTETISNNLNPQWADMDLDTGLPWHADTKLEIQCWDHSTAGKDVLVGYVEVSIGAIISDHHPRYYPLKYDKGLARMGSMQGSMRSLRPESSTVVGEGGGGEGSSEASNLWCFQLCTSEEGSHYGKTFILYTDSVEERAKWVQEIADKADKAKKKIIRGGQGRLSHVLMLQDGLRGVFESNYVQGLMAAVIGCAFVTNVISAEMQPETTSVLAHVLQGFEVFYVYIFTVELVLNVCCNFFWPFVTDLWNYLDVLVVAVSWVSYVNPDGGVGAISVIRLVRVFRVIRVIKQLKSLRRIVKALLSSVIPVSYSLLLLLLATAIFAVVAVDTLGESNPELFGSFSVSFFTMWQVGTGDGWSDVAREFRRESDGMLNPLVALFFAAYVFVVGLVLINIVVAVLLDEFISTVAHEKEQELKELEDQQLARDGILRLAGPMDHLLKHLCKFTTHDELLQMINDLFGLIDTNSNGAVSFDEASEALANLKVRMDVDEWNAMTAGLLNERNELGREGFSLMLRRQLKAYTQRQVVNAMGSQSNDAFYETHLSLKMLMEPGVDLAGETGGGELGERLNEQAQTLGVLREDQRLMHLSLQRLCDTQVKILESLASMQTRMAYNRLNPLPDKTSRKTASSAPRSPDARR
eukprot:Tamp_06098.p1 GENE.Tamp_06098~~Tamp_06098.p1  ORF type:complete len:740 (-),score=154.68 Tamp_06098:113-2332(-)